PLPHTASAFPYQKFFCKYFKLYIIQSYNTNIRVRGNGHTGIFNVKLSISTTCPEPLMTLALLKINCLMVWLAVQGPWLIYELSENDSDLRAIFGHLPSTGSSAIISQPALLYISI
ncbi:MAG: hypothetical protein ACK559_34950, partial [bacterium]